MFCQGFPVFNKIEDCFKYLEKTYEEDRQLLLEQYKIMVGSTEKVTDQRMRVNNLFFTVTSSILSISLVVGNFLLLALSECLHWHLWHLLLLFFGKS